MPNAVSIAASTRTTAGSAPLATHEDCRRRGLGATVLSAALSGWWADHPGETLGLSVRADSLAVLTQYHRLGFEPRLVVTASHAYAKYRFINVTYIICRSAR